MDAHPEFADAPLPRAPVIGRFRLEVLSPKDVQEDFVAVTESEASLAGIFGDDWPIGLTLDDNLDDLARHEAEFDARHAFAWIVRDEAGSYLGCAYVDPVHGTRGKAVVVTWIRERPDRHAILAEFNRAFADWLSGALPSGYELDWTSNDR